MASNKLRLIVLCEDTLHTTFIRAFLRAYYNLSDAQVHHIRFVFLPKPFDGQTNRQGSAAEHVKKNLPAYILDYRARRRENIALIVMIDDDTKERLAEIEKKMAEAEVKMPQEGEAIAIFIPKRAIDTWIYHLKTRVEVDEVTDYKGKLGMDDREKQCKPYVKQLAENCRQHIPLPEIAPESLKLACQELMRIPKF